MSGLLSGILTAVAIVAVVVSGGTLGIVAGALLAASFAANQGWLGKGAQKFAQSSTGKDLTMAIGLASAGIGVAGAMGAALPGTEAAAVQSANAAAEGAGTAANAAADSAGVAGQATAATAPTADASTVSGIAASGDTSAAVTPSGTLAQTTSNANGIINSTVAGNPEVNLVQGSNTVGATADAQAVQTGQAGAGGLSVNPNDPTETQQIQQSLGINTQAQTQTTNTAATQSAVTPSGSAGSQAAAASAPATPGAGGASGYGDAVPPGTPGAAVPNAAAPSMLDSLATKAGNALTTPSGMLMAGQAVSGWAQGKAQENINQRQLAAAQWGNTQWMDPTQVNQLQAAASAPINVPQGYLNRAAAVRNLMNGGTSQTAPLQAPPPAVGAPALPTPGAGAAGAPASSGPVPVYQLGTTPRGGVI